MSIIFSSAGIASSPSDGDAPTSIAHHRAAALCGGRGQAAMHGGHCRQGGTAFPLNFCPRLSSGQGLTDQGGQLCRPCGTFPAHTSEMPAGIRLQDPARSKSWECDNRQLAGVACNVAADGEGFGSMAPLVLQNDRKALHLLSLRSSCCDSR